MGPYSGDVLLTMSELTHFDAAGASRMVDTSAKPLTLRVARASGRVSMHSATLAAIRASRVAKGDVFEVARLAGIMAAKQTAALIPLCHTLALDSVEVAFNFPDEQTLGIEVVARANGRTGVEMEALVAASTVALTIYDMCKAIDRGMVIQRIQLEEKSGGASGHFLRGADAAKGKPT